MITEDQRLQLKEHLGNDYTAAVCALLEERGERTEHGHPHSDSYIRQIFSGARSNMAIEAAIFEVYRARRKAHDAEQTRRQQILNKNSEAVTPES